MITLRPRLHEIVATTDSRTLKQLEALGVDPSQDRAQTTVGISLTRDATWPQRLLALSCLDYILRLDPLVEEVRVDGISDLEVQQLAQRVPLTIGDASSFPVDVGVAVGASNGADVVVDAHGWVASAGAAVGADDQEATPNPIGPLAAAAIAGGEVFKALFALNYPDAPYSRRFVPASGSFSFFDYSFNGANPELRPIVIDAVLVGLGGVGAAVVRTLAELGEFLSGRLSLVDADRLSGDNLNRVTYARWQAALSKIAKVHEAKLYLDARLPRLVVTPNQETFEVYKRKVAARRRDRRYDVIVSGIDNDETRHELQRELPRVAIDAATGRDANLTVERSIIGQWGCLGCSRQMGPPATADVACDELPDDRAPSISFVSGLAGTLAAGELIKEATHPEAALRGAFDHVFIYGLNPDLVHTPAFSSTCRINCSNEPMRAAYLAKYPPAPPRSG